ncbi:MAG: hypothetical protein MHMPM18_001839 [Marteilia pararefringens]
MECESKKIENIAEMSIGYFFSDKKAPKYTYSSISMIIDKIKPIIIDAHKQFSKINSINKTVTDYEFLDCMETEIFLLTFIQTLTNFNDENDAIVNYSELSALQKLSKWMQLCHSESQNSFINDRIKNLNSNYHIHASCNKDSFDPSELGLEHTESVYECLIELFKIGDYKQMLETISQYPGDFQWIGLIVNYFCEFFEGTKAWDKCFIKICENHLKTADDFDNLLMTSIDQGFIGIEECRDMLTSVLMINADSMREKALLRILTESESFDQYVAVFVENFFLDSPHISQKATDMMQNFYNTIDSVLCNHSLLEDALQNDLKLIKNLHKLLFNLFVYKNKQICCLDNDTDSNMRLEIDFHALKLINKMILFYFKTKRFEEVVTLHNQLIDPEGYEFDCKSYEPSRLLLFTLDELSMNFEDHQKYNPINVLFTILYQMSSTCVTKELCIKLANTTKQRNDNEDQSQFNTSFHLLQQTLDSLCQFNLALEFVPNIFMELPNSLSEDEINAIEISLFNLIIDFCVVAKKGCVSSTNTMTDLPKNNEDFNNILKRFCDFMLTKDNKLLGFLNKDHRMQATIFVTEIAL